MKLFSNLRWLELWSDSCKYVYRDEMSPALQQGAACDQIKTVKLCVSSPLQHRRFDCFC